MVNSYDLVRALKLDTLVKSKTPALNIETPEVNRPGLQPGRVLGLFRL